MPEPLEVKLSELSKDILSGFRFLMSDLSPGKRSFYDEPMHEATFWSLHTDVL